MENVFLDSIKKLNRLITRRISLDLSHIGITASQFFLIKYISDASKSCDVDIANISKNLFLDKSTILRNLDVLKRIGVVLASSKPTIGRPKKIFKATANGNSIIKKSSELVNLIDTCLGESLKGAISCLSAETLEPEELISLFLKNVIKGLDNV